MTSVYRHIRSFLNWSVKNGLTSNQRWRGFSVKNEVYVTPIFLTLDERDQILNTDLNHNQSVKRANELAVSGLLTQAYLSQVLLLTISSAQRILSTFHDELFNVTKKAVKLR